ncbi:MAG: phosphotransferase enzyme family protein [Ilumatobacteraceae bacterium]
MSPSERLAVAARAASRWGLPEPTLLHEGTTAVYAAGDDAVLRVGPLPFGGDGEVAFHHRLRQAGVRVPAIVRPPLELDGDAVLAIERVHGSGDVDWAAVGAMVRRVHALDAADWPGLRRCVDFPHWQIDVLLDDVRDELDDSARRGMLATLDGWQGWQAEAMHEPVLCHGDVHPGNVVQSSDGPVLLDWDLRCLGPAAWDHAPLMAWGERWDGEPEWYDAFAEGYGINLRGEWLAECLADLRNLVATLMRVRVGRTDAAAAAEAERRLRYWRGDPEAPRWTPA